MGRQRGRNNAITEWRKAFNFAKCHILAVYNRATQTEASPSSWKYNLVLRRRAQARAWSWTWESSAYRALNGCLWIVKEMAQEEHEMKSIGLNTDTRSISQTKFLGSGWEGNLKTL